jgi:hypothetical protein
MERQDSFRNQLDYGGGFVVRAPSSQYAQFETDNRASSDNRAYPAHFSP